MEIHCSYDPETRGGWSADGRKVKGTLHWVSVEHALDAEVRLYEQLFFDENPNENSPLNPESLVILDHCKIEPSLKTVAPGDRFQFLRQGYFCVDLDSKPEKLIFNRTVGLRDSWGKGENK